MALSGMNNYFHFVTQAGSGSGNYKIINRFASNKDVDSGLEQDIWTVGGTRVYLTAAENMSVISSSSKDSASGDGARNILIEGLDGDYNLIEEVLTMNGTTAVTTSNKFMRINRVFAKDVGSQGINDGDITVDPATSGSGSRQAYIVRLEGTSLVSHYTIPNQYEGYLMSLHFSVGPQQAGTGDKNAHLKFLRRDSPSESWRLETQAFVSTSGNSLSGNYMHAFPDRIPPKGELRFSVLGKVDNTEVHVHYCLLLKNTF